MTNAKKNSDEKLVDSDFQRSLKWRKKGLSNGILWLIFGD
jgi:hypothetical protein